MAQTVKNLPAMWVQFLGQEDSLEKGRATHSNILTQRIPWTEEPGGLQSMGRKELDMTDSFFFFKYSRSVSGAKERLAPMCSVLST